MSAGSIGGTSTRRSVPGRDGGGRARAAAGGALSLLEDGGLPPALPDELGYSLVSTTFGPPVSPAYANTS